MTRFSGIITYMLWVPFSLLNAFFESVSNALGKSGAQKIDILSVAWSQRFFALFILIPLSFATHSLHPVNGTFWIALLVTSALNTITSILFVKAIKGSPLSLTLPIVTLTPLFLLITSPLIVHEFPKPLGLVGILSTVVGSYILNLSKKIYGPFEPILSIVKEEGSRLMLIVAIIWSITSNIDKIAVNNSNPLLFSFASTATILLFLTIVLKIKKTSFNTIFINSRVLAPIGIASGLSTAFQMIAISMTIVPNVITVKRTSAIFGTVWGKLFFKEENIKERLIGTIIMVAGVVLIVLS